MRQRSTLQLTATHGLELRQDAKWRERWGEVAKDVECKGCADREMATSHVRAARSGAGLEAVANRRRTSACCAHDLPRVLKSAPRRTGIEVVGQAPGARIPLRGVLPSLGDAASASGRLRRRASENVLGTAPPPARDSEHQSSPLAASHGYVGVGMSWSGDWESYPPTAL